MIFTEEPENFSSFPQSDNNRVLQEMSLRALRQSLPPSEWVLRDEHIEDAGVDASLELLINSRFTNQRAQVQLKSTEHPRDNADHSVSLSVRTSNLKYLLNGLSPLYVLYIVPRNELRYVWAHDERQRLDLENPDWEQQESVTLRFVNHLSSEALPSIRGRIGRENRLHHEIHKVLGRASAGDTGDIVRIVIDPTTLQSTNPDQALRLILDQGISLVNAGRANEVVDAVDALNPTAVRHPRVQLVYGYACYMQSRYPDAIASLARAAIAQNQLSDDDKQFLRHLRDTCDYRTGRISIDQFAHRQEQWKVGASHAFRIGFRMEELRHALYKKTNIEDRRAYVNQIHQEVNEIINDSSVSIILKAQANNFLLEAEGFQSGLEYSERWSKVAMRHLMKQPIELRQTMDESANQWNRWSHACQQALIIAERLNHPLLIADTRLTRANVFILRLINVRLLAHIFSWPETPVTAAQLLTLEEDIEVSRTFYKEIGQMEGQLRAQMLKAQILILADKTDEAHQIAADVLPVAQAMGYQIVEQQAEQVLSNETLVESSRARAVEAAQADVDIRLAADTDENMRRLAADTHSNLELPPSRLPVVERAVYANRDAARERVSWCRHFELIEDLTHTKDPATLYIVDPEHFGKCEKLGYISMVGSTQWATVIQAFKGTYCVGCPHREPKGGTVSPTESSRSSI